MATATANKSDVQAVDALAQSYKDLKTEIGKVIISDQVTPEIITEALSS